MTASMRLWMPVRLVPAHGVGDGMELAAWTTREHLAARGHAVTVVTTAHLAELGEACSIRR